VEIIMGGVVTAVSCSAGHTLVKQNRDSIRLLAGLGVEGDAHLGATVKHRSRLARFSKEPNLRQVHLIDAELHDELRERGFAVSAGARLCLGDTAVIEVTGLRNPCSQLDRIQRGLMGATLERGKDGSLFRKAGIMAVVLAGGEVRPGDPIRVELPTKPFQSLTPV
jgi:hypothetical protein